MDGCNYGDNFVAFVSGFMAAMPKSGLQMNCYKKNRLAILGVAMACAGLNSSALTLGQARGAVLLGQPLNLTASIQLEPQDVASVLCFDADVFYGDTRLEATQVRVKSEQTASSSTAVVRVESPVRVDEPVVTVYLRAGCEQKITRRYVLLAEPAAEQGPTATSVQTVPPPLTAPGVGAAPATGAERGGVPPRARPAAKERDRTATIKSPVDSDPPLAVKPRAKQGPRLQLLPLDLSIEHDPSLKFTDELLLGATENLQKRAEAVALWRALNATPEDILSAQSQQKTMEADLQGLKVATTKNRQSLQELAGRLESAESQRYFNPLVYALLAVLMLTGVVAVIALRRLRDRVPEDMFWLRDEIAPVRTARDVQAPMVYEGFQLKEKSASVLPEAGKGARVGQAAHSRVDIDIDLDIPDDAPNQGTSNGGWVKKAAERALVDVVATRAAGHVDFAHSMTTSLRALNTKEMLDVRQQAEFFMTLGQHDEAIGMLKDSIEDSEESNPLIYLDLLRDLHTLGRKTEFEHYRADFNALFSGRVPEYAEFNQGGNGLEAYPDVCETISSLWPTQNAVHFIEQCLVHEEVDAESHGFDLEAFRDLMMLHGMAQRMESSSDSGLMPFSATRTAAAASVPKTTVSDRVSQSGVAPDGLGPVSAIDLGTGEMSVDLDLSDSPENLIDFDASDLGIPSKVSPRKP